MQIENLLELKDFLNALKSDLTHKNIHELFLSDDEWAQLENLKTILLPFTLISKNVQSSSVTLSDFRAMWLNTKMKIQRQVNTNTLAKNLLLEMKKFEPVLIDTPLMYAAMYLDPRYNILLEANQRITAENFLESMYQRIEANARLNHGEPVNQEETPLDELSGLINRLRNQNHDSSLSNTVSSVCIKTILRNFKDQRPMSESVMLYWKSQKTTKPELYKLSNVIFAISPTQASVERAFSALALILTHLRTRISDNLLEKILLIRLNKQIL